ncbi:MAG: TonB-dependent receptor plug domain-containing protein [Alphaproteobacteria bacterium]|nr:TonB-dependent receptor plug domain-containing protein [Alphaproteobacteria bacterium]
MIVKWRSALCASIALPLAAMAGQAAAQDAAPSQQHPAASQATTPAGKPMLGTLESVTVTGTKRNELAQDVPISLSAISANQLKNTFRTDILAVSELSPGVQLGQVSGFRAVAGGIRGTGQNSILVTQDSSVVLLLDEFALTNVQSQFVELFDVDRVEVYRGPQGTLFGKSATGGAISIITKRPKLNEFSADIEAQIGKFDNKDGGMIGKGRLAINIPVIQDKLAFRLTAIYDYDDGYFRNGKAANNFPNVVPIYSNYGLPVVNPPFPPELNTNSQGGGEHLNGTDSFSGRFKALLTPSDHYEAYFIFDFLRDRSDAVPGVNESPALGQVDPGVARLSDGTFVRNAPTYMLLPLLGFDGVEATGQKDVYNTGTTNQCFGGGAFCQTKGHRVSVEGYNLQQTLTYDDVAFKLITAYRHMTEILPDTYTGEAFTSLFDASRNTTRKQAQIELRATTTFDGPFNFVAGLSYAYDKTDMLAYSTVGLTSLITFLPSVDPNSSNPLVASGLLDDRGFLNLDLDYINDPTMTGARQKRNTYAIYIDGHYDITDKLRFTLGGRYTYDVKTFFRRQNPGGPCTDLTPARDQVTVNGACLDKRSNAVSRVGSGFTAADLDPFHIPLPDSAFGIADTFHDHWAKLTWRAVLDYKVVEDAMIYASYSTGFIPGGFTETCSSLATCQPFESETNWNAEAGLKARFFDQTLQTNLSVYYTRYSNLVRSQVIPFTDAFGTTTQETINVNAGKSRNIGVELEATWVPLDDLRIDFNMGYMDHKYIEFMLGGQDLSDLTVPFSPHWKLGGGITYDASLGNGGTLTMNTTVNYTSVSESSVFNSLYTQYSARTLWDASLTWRDADERYRVTAYVKNILDQRYRTGANSVAGLWNFTMWGRPREFGMEFGVYF